MFPPFVGKIDVVAITVANRPMSFDCHNVSCFINQLKIVVFEMTISQISKIAKVDNIL